MSQLEEGKKEAIPYDYYTVDNILLDEMVPIDDVKSFFKLDDDKALFENILVDEFEDLTAFNFDVDLTNCTMNPVQYYKYYHKHDCITLRRGVEVFRQRIKEFTSNTLGTEVDILLFATISSFADYYYQNRCCYMGCYELQSNNRSFVQEAVRGGICYANPLFCKQPITGGVSDFDMTSMYPSAQYRIGKEMGYPMGEARKIPADCLNYPLPYYHYIVRVKVLRITKHQQIPFISLKVNGIIQRYNRGELPPETLVVDKITLEDYIQFCGMEFELIGGLY